MYRITIEEINGNKTIKGWMGEEREEENSLTMYEQIFEDLNVSDLVHELNCYEDAPTDEFGHEVGCPYSPLQQNLKFENQDFTPMHRNEDGEDFE